jgi:micrococcal nuclease
MTRYLKIACLFLFLDGGFARAQCGKVLSIHDGDTFTMLFSDNQKQKVRVAFIDAPEHEQEFGEQSTAYAKQLLLDKNVCIDVKYKDRYRRAVAVVTLPNGKILNDEMLKSGMAWHFVKYSDDQRLAKLEQKARKRKQGLWATAQPVAPWEWRKERHIGYQHRK